MLSRLIYLNWSMFLSRMSKLQTVLVIGYIIFLLMLFSNLLGSAVVIALFDSNTMVREQLPWLTMEIRQLILFAFANIFWLLHFSFTSTRLLNMEENRKLLSYSYPVNKLAWHLNLIGFFHPLNIIYNFTWAVFLLIQIRHLWYIPVVLAAVLLNYAIIYSFKHRFLRIIEKRFKIIVFSLVFLLVGTFQAIALILRNPGWFLENYLPDFETVMAVLSYAPGGLLVTSAVHEYDILTGTVAYSFCAALIFLIFRDHYFKTKEGLHAPVRKET
ncbi:MAG: hypothetical protein R3211_11400, partial [Balneolaceae bacterium]|nr:hypothetical protein [Balneolaceae bacterium]